MRGKVMMQVLNGECELTKLVRNGKVMRSEHKTIRKRYGRPTPKNRRAVRQEFEGSTA